MSITDSNLLHLIAKKLGLFPQPNQDYTNNAGIHEQTNDPNFEEIKNQISNLDFPTYDDSTLLDMIQQILDWIVSTDIGAIVLEKVGEWINANMPDVIDDTFTAKISNWAPAIVNNSLTRSVINTFLSLTINKLSDISIDLPEDETKLRFTIKNPLELEGFAIGEFLYRLFARFMNALVQTINEATDWINEHVVGASIYFPIPLLSGAAIRLATKVGSQWVIAPNLVFNPDLSWADIKLAYPALNFDFFNIVIPNKVISTAPLLFYEDGEWQYGPNMIPPKYYDTEHLLTDIVAYGLILLLLYIVSAAGMKLHTDNVMKNMNKQLPMALSNAVINQSVTYKSSIFANMASLLALVNSFLGTANNVAVLNSMLNAQGLPNIPEVNVEKEDVPVDLTEVNSGIDDIQSSLANLQVDLNSNENVNDVTDKLQLIVTKMGNLSKKFY